MDVCKVQADSNVFLLECAVADRFDRVPQNQLDSGGTCVSIRNKTAAYARNRVADEALRNSSIFFSRTWEHSVHAYDQHVTGATTDCTHFCSPSLVMWNLAITVLQSVVNVTRRRK